MAAVISVERELAGGSVDYSGYGGTVGKYTYVIGPLYFLFIGLLFGAFTLYIHREYLFFFPYQALLFVEGMILGLIHAGTQGGMADLSVSIDQWVAIDPHLLSIVFLPALIFSDAMRVDIHLFRRIFSQAAIMSTFGVALQATGTACVAKYFLSQNGFLWDWPLCFTFGSVLAATDPVAVVAMLEAVRAPAKLTILMSGESHLSDLLALVLFNVMLSLSKNINSYTTEELVSYIFSMLFGGPALGVAFGILALFGIRANTAKDRESDVMIQITITIVLAYLSFIISENNAKGNGVLATVTAALIIAAYAWPSFASPQAVRNVWKAIEYTGSTIVFMLAGLVIGDNMYAFHNTYITGEMYGLIILMWLFIYSIRTAIMILFFPILSRIGYGLKLSEGVVMTWGGLKGAVAIALGLIVFNSYSELNNTSNPIVDSKRDAVQFFFLVGGVVFLSVLVNSSTTPFLMRALKILSKSKVQHLLLRGIQTRIHAKAHSAFKELTDIPEYSHVEMDMLKGVIAAFNGQVGTREKVRRETCWHRVQVALGARKKDEAPVMVTIDGHVCNSELLEVVRELFLDIVKASYWEMIENGILPRNSVATRTLLQSIDIAKDSVDQPINDYQYMNLAQSKAQDENSLHERLFASIDRCLPDWVTIDDYFGDKFHTMIRENSVFMASSFIHAHKEAQGKIAQYVGEGDDADSPEENVVIAESERLVKLATDYMDICKQRDPDIVNLVTAKKVGSHVLKEQDELIDQLEKQGVLDEQTTEELHDAVTEQYRKLYGMSLNKFRARKSMVGTNNNNNNAMIHSAQVMNESADIIDKNV